MFLKRLILENFQSHKRTTLEFHPNFNCIVGSSNVGKTAISRALAFILTGQWDSSWVRHGQKSCRITLETSDGITVVREKGEKLNKYVLTLPGQTPQVYENFGTEVPSEIAQALKMFKVQIDSNEYLNLNLSTQLDPLFLLQKSGSFKAKVLGKLSGAHFLDYALRELNKDKRNLQSEKGLKETENLEVERQLVSFQGLEDDQQRLEAIGGRIKDLEARQTRLDALRDLFDRAQDWKARYTSELASEAKFSAPVPTIDALDGLAKRLNDVADLHSNYIRIQAAQEKSRSEIARLEERIQSSKDTYVRMLEEQKICPTCLTPVTEFDHIRGSL